MMQRVTWSLAVGLTLMLGGCPTTPAPETGACCLQDGSCTETTLEDCTSAGGSFAAGQGCEETNCGTDSDLGATPVGACCLDDGTCVPVAPAVCATLGGRFNPNDTCEEADCASVAPDTGTTDPDANAVPTGACCLEDGNCAVTTTEICTQLGGTFAADATCATVDCGPAPAPSLPKGACCLSNGTCVFTDAVICETLAGSFEEGQPCAFTNCPPPPPPSGACCLVDGTCLDSDSEECAELGGVFNFEKSCAEVFCAPADRDDLRMLAEGLEISLRDQQEVYINDVSIIGREYWNLNGDNSYYTGVLLGKNGASLGADDPMTTRSFRARYKTIAAAQQLIDATQSSSAAVTINEVDALLGYARTVQAYQYILLLGQQYTNGIRPYDAPGAPTDGFLSYTDSLAFISNLLDEAAVLLQNGGSAFLFEMSGAFAGFHQPSTMRQFNRALAARVRMYQGDKVGAINAIASSFFNFNGDLYRGPAHAHSLEYRNPLHYGSDDLVTVHPDFVADAEPGDIFVSSWTQMYGTAVTFDGLTGDRQVRLYGNSTDSVPLMINAELVLIYGEAQIGSDVNEVLAAINRIRNARGLGNYLGATDDASLKNEVYKQRRFMLFGLGHYWIDVRRNGNLSQIVIDRPGDVVHEHFPRPSAAVLSEIFASP